MAPGFSLGSGKGTDEPLSQLGEGLGRGRSGYSLLVCCSAFHGITAAQAIERWPHLTLKKIPKMVLARCEWGHDDYSLNVANLPMAEPSPPAPLLPVGEGRLYVIAVEQLPDIAAKMFLLRRHAQPPPALQSGRRPGAVRQGRTRNPGCVPNA